MGGFGIELEDERQDRVAPISIQEAVQHGCAGNEVKRAPIPSTERTVARGSNSVNDWMACATHSPSTFRGQSALEWCCCLFDCENNLLSNRGSMGLAGPPPPPGYLAYEVCPPPPPPAGSLGPWV